MNPFNLLSAKSTAAMACLIPVLALAPAGAAKAEILINEVDATTSGNTPAGLAMHDCVELLNTGGSAVPLTDRAIVLFRGTAGNVAYDGMDLDSFSIPGGGLLTAGSYATPHADMVVEYSAAFAGSPLLAGPAGATLIKGDFVLDQAVTAIASADLLDGLVYKPTSLALGTSQTALKNALHPATPEINEAGLLLDAPNQSISRGTPPGMPRDTTTYAVGSRTPGAVNDPSLPRLGFLWVSPPAGNSVSESGGVLTGKLTRTGSTASPVTVALTNKDVSEWTLPVSVTIPAGATESATFTANAANDGWKDGNVTAYFHATAPGYSPASGWAVITDDESAAAEFAVTEVHSHIFGDANGDGTVTPDDQFVEIVNLTDFPRDISGFKLNDGTTDLFTFPVCTVLAPRSAAVVFRGIGAGKRGITSDFGTAAVFHGPGLVLLERGGSVRLLSGGNEIAGLTYWPYPGGSNTVDGSYVLQKTGHRLVAGASGLFSPGKTIADAPYATAPGPVVLSFTRACLSRLEPAGAVKLVITIPARTYDVTVCLSQSGTGVLPVTLNQVVPANTTSVQVSLTPVASPAGPDAAAGFAVTGTGIFRNSAPLTDLQVVGTDHASASALLAGRIALSAGNTASAFTFELDANVAVDTPVSFTVVSPASGSGVTPAQSSVTIPAGKRKAVTALNAVPAGTAGDVVLQAFDTVTCRAIRKTVTVNSGGGISPGPFLTEIEAQPPASPANFEFVEIGAPAGTSLSGFSLVTYSATGAVLGAVALTGSTGASGLLLVHDPGLPGTGARQSAALDLDDAGGGVALYRGAAPAALTTDNLIDAIAYGSAAPAVRLALMARVNYAPNPEGALEGLSAAAAPGGAAFTTLARATPPAGIANLRNSGDWTATSFATPGLPAGSSSLAVWANVFGVSADCAQFVNSNPSAVPPVIAADTDRDGTPDWQEFVEGTNPVVRNAPKGWTITGSGPSYTFSTQLNPLILADTAHFTVIPQSSTQPNSAWSPVAWTSAPTVSAPTGTIVVNTASPPRNFFRLKVECRP